MTRETKPGVDWEAIEKEFRAGQLSVREIARRGGLTEAAIRKRAKHDEWTRPLADKVREAVREKLVRTDGAREGSQDQRASDAEIIEKSAKRGLEVIVSHRRDLSQLHDSKRILGQRLAVYLQGGTVDGPFIGDKESPGDLLEKLSRVSSRLIPLERQAFNLDDTQGKTPDTANAPRDLSGLSDDDLDAVERIVRKVADTGGNPGRED